VSYSDSSFEEKQCRVCSFGARHKQDLLCNRCFTDFQNWVRAEKKVKPNHLIAKGWTFLVFDEETSVLFDEWLEQRMPTLAEGFR